MKPKNPDFKNLHIWGLTGGIASGKSSVADILRNLGFCVVDADQITRDLLGKSGPARTEVEAEFGSADREQLRGVVFHSPEKRKRLEAILHPHIIEESSRQLFRGAMLDARKVAFYEATLLVETGRFKDFEGLLVVDAPEADRRARLRARNGFSDKLIDEIFAAQASESARNQAANLILNNSGSIDELRAQILNFLQFKGWLN